MFTALVLGQHITYQPLGLSRPISLGLLILRKQQQRRLLRHSVWYLSQRRG